jgi:hypothetical protein
MQLVIDFYFLFICVKLYIFRASSAHHQESLTVHTASSFCVCVCLRHCLVRSFLHVSSYKRSSSGVPHRTYSLQFLCFCLRHCLVRNCFFFTPKLLKYVPYSTIDRDSTVVIATCYVLDGPGIESRWRRDFPHPSRPALGPNFPPLQWVSGYSRGQEG